MKVLYFLLIFLLAYAAATQALPSHQTSDGADMDGTVESVDEVRAKRGFDDRESSSLRDKRDYISQLTNTYLSKIRLKRDTLIRTYVTQIGIYIAQFLTKLLGDAATDNMKGLFKTANIKKGASILMKFGKSRLKGRRSKSMPKKQEKNLNINIDRTKKTKIYKNRGY
ncbi:uncharacterized protein LOC123316241 isoform X1 [Coccinella septempunctata]|uniref:uncharacterized protein LOC123316241 isoform X1 n=1 Tax=Coccinella septempunctata TaxID=41139 RepID=UPI001D076CAB|nr:uncharacterized protein LOC123316241 isoform X1 [Coccinella septempunctata]